MLRDIGEPHEGARKSYAARARIKEAGATRLKAASEAEDAGRDKCLSRPGSFGEALAAIRGPLAFAGGYVAAFGRKLERKGLVAAAVIISSQVKLILTP
jgi:hypothetical protein